MGAVDTTISKIRRAVELKSKLAIAGEAGIRDTVLRGLESEDWNPTADTLRKLEPVADRVVAAAEAETKTVVA